MTNEPLPLPFTSREALERLQNDVSGIFDNPDQDAIAKSWGLTFAPDPEPSPPRKWPAKLAVRLDYGLVDAETGESFCAVVSSAPEEERGRMLQLARRWNRCEELEHDIEEGWRRAAQIDRGIIDEQRERIGALLAQLAERTRERDAARRDAEARRLEGEGCERLYLGSLKAREELTDERDDLRRRCDAALREINKSTHEGHYREAESGALDCGTCRAREILAGRNPVPGDGGGDA